MPLQLTFHLVTARHCSVVTQWSDAKPQLTVMKITGNTDDTHVNRIVWELRKHALEAGYTPKYLGDELTTPDESEDLAWTMLASYDGLDDQNKKLIDECFAEIFQNLDVEESSSVGIHREWGEICLYLKKPNGAHTDAWVWRDSLRWIQAGT